MKSLILSSLQTMAFFLLLSCARRSGSIDPPPPSNSPPSSNPSTPVVPTPVVSVVTYRYVATNTADMVSRCLINNSDGGLANCSTVATGIPSFNGISGVAIFGNYGYVTNLNTNTVTVCTVGDTWSSCADAGVSSSILNSPSSIVFSSSSAIYITNNGANNVILCTGIAPNGTLSGCASMGGAVFNRPSGIAINGTSAYVTNYGNNTVLKCNVSNVGVLNSCSVSADPSFVNPQGIAVNGNYVYITNTSSGTVSICSSNLSSCTASSSFGDLPMDIKITNGFAYISLYFSGIVERCSINSSSGLFSVCDSNATNYNFGIPIIGLF